MNPVVVIFGANGYPGRYLSRYFARQGREVVAVVRGRDGWSGDGMLLEWDGETAGPWTLALEGAEAVIHLVGQSPDEGQAADPCRLRAAQSIGRAIADCKVPPRVWLNAGTVAWYRDAEDGPQDDWLGEPGEGGACELARAWEEAFFAAWVPPQTRKLVLRLGTVLANEPEAVFGISGRPVAMGGGRERVSWIHMEDFLRAVDFLIADSFISGAVNLTAPECPTHREWMRYFRAMAGSKPPAQLLSRWAEPRRLTEAGFRWRFGSAAAACADLQSRCGLDGFFHAEAARTAATNARLPAAIR